MCVCVSVNACLSGSVCISVCACLCVLYESASCDCEHLSLHHDLTTVISDPALFTSAFKGAIVTDRHTIITKPAEHPKNVISWF